MKITFIGHVSKDVNIIIDKRMIVAGGGVFFGSIAASRLGAEVTVFTKCATEDITLFGEMTNADVDARFLRSLSSTSIENVYPTSNPDDRRSRVLSLAEPFRMTELQNLNEEMLHINPLWHGEFPEKLIPEVKKKTKFLIGDAQGFLRNVENGEMTYKNWKDKEHHLKCFDLFKVDINESRILTGRGDIKIGAKAIHDMGASIVITTHQKGVCVYDGKKFYEADFGNWKLEGRTGRGDTCTAAFIVAINRMNLKDATHFAADITSKKMQYPGPYNS